MYRTGIALTIMLFVTLACGDERAPDGARADEAAADAPEAPDASGDVIGITTYDGKRIGTSHVGLAYRDGNGVLRFMHASAPRNHGKVVLDMRLKDYLYKFRSNAGIMVARPLR